MFFKQYTSTVCTQHLCRSPYKLVCVGSTMQCLFIVCLFFVVFLVASSLNYPWYLVYGIVQPEWNFLVDVGQKCFGEGYIWGQKKNFSGVCSNCQSQQRVSSRIEENPIGLIVM